jgi:hypothetical protein
MKIVNIEQGTPEWHALRRCKVTGTKLEDVMGSPLARTQLIAELIAEEATEQSKIIKATEEMERGINEEEFAIKLYEEQTGREVTRGNIWLSSEYSYLACSPDGFLPENNEALEVKNPDSKTAIFNRLANMIPMDELGLASGKRPFLGIPIGYKWQCVNYFLVNRELQKLHFLIHDARFIDPKAKLYIVTLDIAMPELQEAVTEAEVKLVKFREDWLRWKEIILPTEF